MIRSVLTVKPKYKRVMIKISGEALAGDNGTGLDFKTITSIAQTIAKCVGCGAEIAMVVGGGNFWRGRSGKDMDRTRADHMGMLATTINALAIADSLEAKGVPTRVQTGIDMRQIAEPYIRGKAVSHLEKGRVVVFACGSGNPFFSTDTAAALRAAEIGADIILLAKNVDAVYDSDPNINPDAVKYDTLDYISILNSRLGVMDSTATSLCMDNDIPILVFGINDPENVIRAIKGEKIGTMVDSNK